MMLWLILTLAAIWLVLCAMAVVLCVAAARGDREESARLRLMSALRVGHKRRGPRDRSRGAFARMSRAVRSRTAPPEDSVATRRVKQRPPV
jgi:hypothetical protein